jgi:proline dehydrogenase
LASRFVAGETLPSVLEAVRTANARGMTATLDHLGENVTSPREAENAAGSYVEALEEIGRLNLQANVSCKLTHLGLDLGRDLAYSMVQGMVLTAASHDNFVRIDMESAKYTDVTLETTCRLFEEHGHVGTVIQAYLYRSADDVRRLNRLGIRIRLVKGAYLEPPSVAFPQKRDVDDNFRRLAELMLHDGAYPAFATHDASIIDFIRERALALGRSRDDFEFQMLYGIRRDLQRSLRDDGYRMRLYIPYGTQWYAYLMRRLAERPANLMSIAGSVAKEMGSR